MRHGKQKTVAVLAGAAALASGAYALGSQSDGSAVASGAGGARDAFVHYGPGRGGGPEFGLERLADRLGVDADKLRDALQAARDTLPDPRDRRDDFAQDLAKELGTTEAKVEAALERLRDKHEAEFEQRRDALAEDLAKRLNLDAAKVKEALEAPGFFFRHP